MRRGWDPDGIAGVIAYESAFIPSAKNPLPKQTASGLIQFIDATARGLGTTAAKIRKMSSLEQLPYILKYYERGAHGRKLRGADFLRMGWGGKAAQWGLPASTVLAEPGSDEWGVNPALRDKEARRITVQTLLDRWGARYARATRAGKYRVPALRIDQRGRRADGGGSFFAVAALALGLGVGVWAWRKGRP